MKTSWWYHQYVLGHIYLNCRSISSRMRPFPVFTAEFQFEGYRESNYLPKAISLQLKEKYARIASTRVFSPEVSLNAQFRSGDIEWSVSIASSFGPTHTNEIMDRMLAS